MFCIKKKSQCLNMDERDFEGTIVLEMLARIDAVS